VACARWPAGSWPLELLPLGALLPAAALRLLDAMLAAPRSGAWGAACEGCEGREEGCAVGKRANRKARVEVDSRETVGAAAEGVEPSPQALDLAPPRLTDARWHKEVSHAVYRVQVLSVNSQRVWLED
jgi:hypothetical protein